MDNITYGSSASSFSAQTSRSEADIPYTHGQYWPALNYYGMAMDISPEFIQPAFPPPTLLGLEHVQNPIHFATPSQPPAQLGRTDSENSVQGFSASSRSESQDQDASRPHTKDQEPEPRCAGQHHQHRACEFCQRGKREKRKEQNRQAQRKHRLRSEAKLEQLQTKLQEQTNEIARLKEINQSLLERIDQLTSNDSHGEPC